MANYAFAPAPLPALDIENSDEQYPVRRIFCVGRNYAEHAVEMGNEVDREAPFYFTKSAFAYSPSGSTVAYSPGTDNLHHEMEFVVALGKPVFKATQEEAGAAIFGYGCGLDMTRRDLQQNAKDKRRSWDLGKDFENSAVLTGLFKASEFGAIENQRIHLSVNGETKQDASLNDMVWRVEEIISHLSGFYHLGLGDIIMTGTPAGVGPVLPGDKLTGGIEGLPDISLTIAQAE